MYSENMKIPFKSLCYNKRVCYTQKHFSDNNKAVMQTESNTIVS